VVTTIELLTKTEPALSYAERISALIQSRNLGAILIKISDNEDSANAARSLPAGCTLFDAIRRLVATTEERNCRTRLY
jgi:hypothetical protein